MPSKSVLTSEKKLHGHAGFNGGTPVSISPIPEGFTAKILFGKNRKKKPHSYPHMRGVTYTYTITPPMFLPFASMGF